jgi:hypothetical protein
MRYNYFGIKGQERKPREIPRSDVFPVPKADKIWRVPANILVERAIDMILKKNPAVQVMVGKQFKPVFKPKDPRMVKEPKLVPRKKRSRKRVKPIVYHGTTPYKTHLILKEFEERNGVTLNLYKGFSKIKRSFEKIEELGLVVFIDNGSFERFREFTRKKTICERDYFSFEKASEYFKYITGEYEKLFKFSKKPENLIITIPEVIASSDVTQKLQAKYMKTYKAWQDRYGFKMIVSMQFNPKSYEWEEQMRSSAKYIDKNFPKTVRIGIPFGEDFKSIQNKDSYRKVEDLFDDQSVLDEFNAHLFATGTPPKIRKFGTKHFIHSIDASTMNRISGFASYVSYKTARIIESRCLRGINKKGEKIPKAKQDECLNILKAENIDPAWWLDGSSFEERFKINVKNLNLAIKNIKEGKVKN